VTKLVKPEGTVWAMTDGDEAGMRCAGSIFVYVGSERLVRYVNQRKASSRPIGRRMKSSGPLVRATKKAAYRMSQLVRLLERDEPARRTTRLPRLEIVPIEQSDPKGSLWLCLNPPPRHIRGSGCA
jgi:hypothetical protein